MTADAAQAAQHVRDVAAEDARQRVHLVHDHVAQVAEERRPPQVVRKDARVEHVRVGEDDVGRAAERLALRGRRVSVEDPRRQLARERAQFNIENFIVAYQFCLPVPATKGIAKRGSTGYGIKHTAEKYYGTYISNGELIAAAIAAGFRFEAFPDSPNVFFNMSRGKLNALHQEANNENAGHQR